MYTPDTMTKNAARSRARLVFVKARYKCSIIVLYCIV